MCLIIVGSGRQVRQIVLGTKGMLDDIYGKNPDGIGAMWASRKRGLRIVRAVPRDVKEVRAMVESFPDDDRQVVWHLRQATHGAVDIDNAHPCVVVPGKVAMVHNGILDTGNDGSPEKSDTRCFIETYLADAVAKCPDVIHSPGFVQMVGDFIGSNRFVFMDAAGAVSIVNKDQGTEAQGLWFSNTYAWSPSMLIPGYYARHLNWGASKYDYNPYNGFHDERSREDDFISAVLESDAYETGRALRRSPHRSIQKLLQGFKATPSAPMTGKGADAFDKLSRGIISAAVENDAKALSDAACEHPEQVADVLCYYLYWTARGASEAPVAGVSAKTSEYTYEGFDITLRLHPRATGWGYVVHDENRAPMALGDSDFETEDDALQAAAQDIDDIISEDEMYAARHLREMAGA